MRSRTEVAIKLLDRRHFGQGGGAELGAIGEAEEDQAPLAVQDRLVDRLSVLIDQLERSADGRLTYYQHEEGPVHVRVDALGGGRDHSLPIDGTFVFDWTR